MDVIIEKKFKGIIAIDKNGKKYSLKETPKDYLGSQIYSSVWEANVIDSIENTIELVQPKFSIGENLGWWIEEIAENKVYLRRTFLDISYQRYGSVKRGHVETTGFSIESEKKVFDIHSDDFIKLFGKIIKQKDYFEEIKKVLKDNIENFESKFSGFIREFTWKYEDEVVFCNHDLDERFEHCKVEKGNWYLCKIFQVPYVVGEYNKSHMAIRIIRQMKADEIVKKKLFQSTKCSEFSKFKAWSNSLITSSEESFIDEEFVSLDSHNYGEMTISEKANGQKSVSGKGRKMAISHAKKIKANRERVSYLLSLSEIKDLLKKTNTFISLKQNPLFKELVARDSWSRRNDCYMLNESPLLGLDHKFEFEEEKEDIYFIKDHAKYCSSALGNYRLFLRKNKLILENSLKGIFPDNTLFFPNGLNIFIDPNLKKSSSKEILYFYKGNLLGRMELRDSYIFSVNTNLKDFYKIIEESFNKAGENGKPISPGWEEISKKCKTFFPFDKKNNVWARTFFSSSDVYGGYDEPRWDGDIGG